MIFQPAGGGAGILSCTQTQRDALTPSNGTVIYNQTSLRVEQYDSTNLIWRKVGDPLAINYIINNNAESSSTQGWATYADAAGTTPVDGTGGVPTVTWGVSSTTPLRNIQDFNFVKDAANRQGEGVSYNFTIDRADQGRQLSIAFDYEVVSGTFASGDMTVWVYDVTNSVLLPQPSGNSIISTSIPSQQGQCTFQTAINSTSYRLIFHVSTVSASAYTLAFDNVSVGPQVTNNAPVMLDWQAYTPTFTGFGTVSTSSFWWRREGDSIQIRGTWTNGTVTAVEARISLPTGATSSSNISSYELLGIIGRPASGATYFHTDAAIETSKTYIVFSKQDSGVNNMTKMLGTGFANAEACSMPTVTIPIAGWSSNAVSSTSANTRLVDFVGTQTSQAVTANVTNISFTSTKDSVAAWATNIYTVAVPGDYVASLNIASAGAGTLSIYKNGSVYAQLGTVNASTAGGTIVLPNLIVGDTISWRCSASITVTVGSASIFLLQGPQQIAASERISFSASTSSTAATTSAPFLFTAISDNTHGAYVAATGKFTAPAPGFYSFNSGILTSVGSVSISLYKTGSVIALGTPISTTTGGVVTWSGPMAAGDTMEVRPSGNATGSGVASQTYFSGFRVGGG